MLRLGRMYLEPSKPISEGDVNITAHVDTKSQKERSACPFNRHEDVLPPS